MRLIVHPGAAEEFAATVRYYDSQGIGLGDRFSDECDIVIRRILESPTRHRSTAEGARQVRLRRFPYHITYQPDQDAVLIAAFAHDRRRPGYWRSRLSD